MYDTMHTPVFPVIRGADIVAWTTVEITPDQPLDFHWEGHGFKVHIPAGAIGRERGRVTLCIQASLSGDYQLQDDGVLVSGVYWLSLHPHVERFDKKVTISLQHCASDDDSDSALTFVRAKCTQTMLPYVFESLQEGVFSTHGYASIETTAFSGFGVRGKGIECAISLHYFCKDSQYPYEAHITVIPDLNLTHQVMQIGHYYSVEFNYII